MTSHVLIVGAGPAGLSLALMLLRQGITVRVIDKNEGPSIYSKAQVIHARTLEVFDELGVAEPFLARGRRVREVCFSQSDGTRITAFEILMPGDDTRYPFLLNLSQSETEKILREALHEKGVSVEWLTRLDHFNQDDTGVEATLVHSDGRNEQIRAPFVVGCDGAHSTVRKALGLCFDGSTYDWKITQADLHVEFPQTFSESAMLGFIGPSGIVAFFPLPGDQRYRMMVFDETENPTLEFFQQAAETRAMPGTKVSDPRWMVSFRVNCRQAEQYRQGRVFIAGDAAHIHSPAGGQGMNTGIQDAWNLSWKLAAAVRGQATPALLDSYHQERHPVAAAVLRGTDLATHGLYAVQGLKNPLLTQLRNAAMSFVTSLDIMRETAGRTLSELDIGYRDSALVGQQRGSLWQTRGLGGTDESPLLSEWFDLGRGPQPGQRIPNLAVAGVAGIERIHDLIRGTGHTLLLFDGPAASDAGYQRLAEVVQRVRGRYGDRVSCRVVIPGEQSPTQLASDCMVHDTQRQLHAAFHAVAECLYLVRPDGYLGFRSMPADGDAVLAHLATVFCDS